MESAIDHGVDAAKDLGKLGTTAGKVLKGIAGAGVVISALQMADDLSQKNPNYGAAEVHGLDVSVGVAALVLINAVVGPIAAPIIAGAALVYGVLRLFWGPGSD